MDSQTWIDTLLRAPFPKEAAFTDTYTWGEVRKMADGLAAQMTRAGQGLPVCLCTADRAVVAASLIAALETGNPLILPHANSTATLVGLQAEIAYAATIVDPDLAVALPSGVAVLHPRAVEKIAASSRPSAPQRAGTAAHNPWVYLFTGGSTGRPKLWTKTPTNLLAETDYLVGRFGISASDRILATAPPNHIYGLLYGVMIPLMSGARVSAATPVFPHEILTTLTRSKATILVSLPVHYRGLREHTFGDHNLRLAFSSAGPLDPADAEAFSAVTEAPVYEIYGSTETGGIASRCRHLGETDLTPFAPVRVAVEGPQAWVASAFVSPDLPRDSLGRFRLADRLEATAEGGLRLQGRSDGIVKVGGKRVDLEVVREALMNQVGVVDAVVFGRSEGSGRATEIVAVVEGPCETVVLREHLQGCLEPHALPRRIKVVSKIPILATGKYDRRRLHQLLDGDG